MTTTTKITVDTKAYERTWSRKPKGHGFWLFAMTAPDGRCGQFSHSSAYGEAARQAKVYAKANGATTIELVP
jgi:hypothetical protein